MWKYVFNGHLYYGDLAEKVKKARESGYQFISFNDVIYFISDTHYFKVNIDLNIFVQEKLIN